MMFSAVISGRIGRDHCGLPCGVLRYMWAWIAVILPMIAGFEEIGGVGVLAHGTSLMADLHRALAGPSDKPRASAWRGRP